MYLALFLVLTVLSLSAQTGRHQTQTIEQTLAPLTVAAFSGAAQDSIQAAALDSSGYLYVAGTTRSPNFPVKNAQQPVFAETSILRTTNLGATWTHLANPPGGAATLTPDPIAPQILFAANAGGIYKSSDSGNTWQLANSAAATSIAIDPGNHLHIAAVTSAGALLLSLDGGATWTPGATSGVISCGCDKLLADPAGSGTLLSTGLGGGAISRDWGVTLQPFGPNGALGTPTAAAFDPSHPGWIYVNDARGAQGSLYLTTDYGATWTLKPSPPNAFGILNLAVDPANPNLIVAALPGGFYKSTDGANTWTPEQSSFNADPYFNPEPNLPFVLVPENCNPAGGLMAAGSGITGSFSVSFSPDFGATWQTPQLSNIATIAVGPGCAFYIARTLASDAFVARIAPDGTVLWATYLGGSDRDTPAALAVDSQNNVYVAGNTTSPDFPATAPHIGTQGESSVFLAKFAPNGSLLSSITLGGELSNNVVALALDTARNAYLAGRTNSRQFPVTPGTIVSTLQQGSYTGFLARLSPAAGLTYSTYLGQSYTYPGSILVDADQQVTVAGSGLLPVTNQTPPSDNPQFVMKLDSAAATVLQSTYLPTAGDLESVTGIAADAQNNLVLLGQTSAGSVQATPGAYAPPAIGTCQSSDLIEYLDNGAFVMKLDAKTWQPVYVSLFNAVCGVEPGGISLDPTGAPVIALGATSGLFLKTPIAGGPPCSPYSSAVAKLSADGSTLEYATYLPDCGVPALALAPDGSIFAGVTPVQGNGTAVLRLSAKPSTPVSLDGISNIFSGDSSAVAPSGLYSLAVSGIDAPSTNLGLNPSQSLPTQLAGVQVLFNGEPAPIVSVTSSQIIAAAPPALPDYDSARTGGLNVYLTNSPSFTSIQVVYNSLTSNAVWMPVSKTVPGLLTTDFFNPQAHAIFADAFARNADGTQNSPANPAAAGSAVTLYATGLGRATPVLAPGAIATSATAPALTPIYSTWESAAPGTNPPALAVAAIPGYLSGVFQIALPVPANVTSLYGTDLGNGLRRVYVALELYVPFAAPVSPVSNYVSIYLH